MRESLSRIQLFVTPWTITRQAPLSKEFSRQEYWGGLLFPSLGNLPYPGIESRCPASQANFLPSEPHGKVLLTCVHTIILIWGHYWGNITFCLVYPDNITLIWHLDEEWAVRVCHLNSLWFATMLSQVQNLTVCSSWIRSCQIHKGKQI